MTAAVSVTLSAADDMLEWPSLHYLRDCLSLVSCIAVMELRILRPFSVYRLHHVIVLTHHIVPGDDSNKKAITVKTDCSFKCYGFFWL